MYDALANALAPALSPAALPLFAGGTDNAPQLHDAAIALPFDFRDDPTVYDVADEFMCGPAFLVCPVYRPMAYGPGSRPLNDVPSTRRVYMPAGADWFDLWTDEVVRGGVEVEAAAPMDRIPVFVRAGSIVPMGPDRDHAGVAPDAPLELHVYPGRDTAFTLYEDAGDGYGYEAGEFATVELSWNDGARRLTIGQRIGAYPGMPREREFHVVVHSERGDTNALGAPAERRWLCYAGDPVEVRS